MYGDQTSLIAIIIGLVVLVAFFILVNKVGKIYDILKIFKDMELKKPENRKTIKCEKCEAEISVSIFSKGELINCPKCKVLNRVP